ncbi:alkaline phosphatase [uncultured Desulfobacter sp.]|uniref:alkaline phosphatase n=1 Tax=uncultured Desulfobacter sp. TaxID=240139 RepID=UPI002AAB6471|nr:alkaline phosphatase [uncultured Desulfobacter sp.]
MQCLKQIKSIIAAGLLLLFMAASAFAGQPRYVFYFIGDGLGAAQRQFSDFFLQEQLKNPDSRLLMNTFEIAGINTTYCADTLITDSAAAGTALASGVKTNKGVIGKDVNGNNVKTLTEAAKDHGMKTGIITTTRLTHATPAAFAAHNVSRNNENEIADDFLNSDVDFFAGGGIRHFIPSSMKIEKGDAIGKTIKSKRKDEKNLVKGFQDKGYSTYIGMNGAKAFRSADFSKQGKVFAAFTYTHMPYEVERMNQYKEVPSIAEMTRAGIDVLDQGDKGFFLMVEGGRIDHAAHANDPTGVIWDTIAFDDAIKTAYEFLKTHKGQTLIVVVGDHETGGMGLGMDSMGYKLNMAALNDIHVSVEDTLNDGAGQYKGDKAGYLNYLSKNFGLSDLTDAETASLNKAMDAADAGQTLGYYKLNPAALTAAHILSTRANINWTTTIHTATMIPMSATGTYAGRFGGYKDNTQIAQTMAQVLGFSL